MRYLFINGVCGIRSTGRICTDLATALEAEGNECKIAYGRENIVPKQFEKYAVRIGNDMDVRIHALESRILDNAGFGSKRATAEFLKWADEYSPDVLWLHNIHGYYINVEMLFAWIKNRPNIEVKWTLHDCWPFTGHCTHFSYVKCDKWKNGCGGCVQKKRYPATFVLDSSHKNYARKKAAFTGVNHMTIITPSNWLASLVKQSFLGGYNVEVVNNTIDKEVFRPVKSDFKQQYGLENKYVILGVASMWNDRKGLNDFIELAGMLDERFTIVLVGLTAEQIKKLPKSIKGIERTNSLEELVNAYNGADVFVNPSKEETFGMTTVEAQSCGIPAVVYKWTACEEIIDKSNGLAVDNSILELKGAVLKFAGGHIPDS